ncbi:hypothetical protein POPTR_010G246300v4 [Populus trichocarpa]|uniref:Uncharacterized protein n=2 Tax=Populus trichocarpa TaxID=3694 RepID=A0A2K1YZQ9_POPTR|nr:hypothetical protein POPTR_010G246300v4 [Populus trichocarpa]
MTGLLLLSSHEVKGSATKKMDRCSSKNEITVAQGPAGTLPSGIPQFSVEIANTNSQVPIANIHLNCKEFSSAILVNPEIFKRIAVDDCLVNDGRALASSRCSTLLQINTPTPSNTLLQFSQPLVKSSAVSCAFSIVAS